MSIAEKYNISFDIPPPDPNLKKDYSITSGKIESDLSELFAIRPNGKPTVAYYLILGPRGVGKTYTLCKFLHNKISNPELKGENLEVYLASSTINMARRNIWDSGYMPVDEYVNGESKNTYIHKNSGVAVYFAGLANNFTASNNRGMHTALGFFDDAGERKWEQFSRIFGSVGSTKGCKHIISATGASTDSIPAVLESKLRDGIVVEKEQGTLWFCKPDPSKINPDSKKGEIQDGALWGIIRRFNPYDLYRQNPCVERYKEIKNIENTFTIIEDSRDALGKPIREVVCHFYDNPNFWREVFGFHENTESLGRLAFPSFRESVNVIDYRNFTFDRNGEVIFISDTGNKDAYSAYLFQVQNGVNYMFGEMYHDYKGRSLRTFISDVEEFLDKFGLTVYDKNLFLFSDQHGSLSKSNWNQAMELAWQLADGEVMQVGVAEEGRDLLNLLLQEGKFIVTADKEDERSSNPRNCRYAIHSFLKAREVEKREKIEVQHNLSHSVVPSLYFVQTDFVSVDIGKSPPPLIAEKKEKMSMATNRVDTPSMLRPVGMPLLFSKGQTPGGGYAQILNKY